MRAFITGISAALIIILNALIGYHYPPSGILGTPIILGISSLIIVLGVRKTASILKSLLIFAYAVLNDYLVMNYSGEPLEQEGSGSLNSYLMYGLIVSYVILILGTFKTKDKLSMKILAWILFPVLVLLYSQIR